MLLVGPIDSERNAGGVAGMLWFFAYLDDKAIASRWLCSSDVKHSTHGHATQERVRMLARPGAVRIDDVDEFLAACRKAKAAAGNPFVEPE